MRTPRAYEDGALHARSLEKRTAAKKAKTSRWPHLNDPVE
jgi:hypothetical protein